MVLSKRERYISIITVSVLAVLGLYQFVVEPLLTRHAELSASITAAQDKLEASQRKFETSRRASKQWSQMVSGGLHTDESAAENLLLNNLREWGQESGMSISSLKPERNEKEKDFYRKTIRATGTGNMSQIGRFLWRIQSSTIPIRVSDLQISSRREGSDDLAIILGVSTIYLAPQTDKSPRPAGATASARELSP